MKFVQAGAVPPEMVAKVAQPPVEAPRDDVATETVKFVREPEAPEAPKAPEAPAGTPPKTELSTEDAALLDELYPVKTASVPVGADPRDAEIEGLKRRLAEIEASRNTTGAAPAATQPTSTTGQAPATTPSSEYPDGMRELVEAVMGQVRRELAPVQEAASRTLEQQRRMEVEAGRKAWDKVIEDACTAYPNATFDAVFGRGVRANAQTPGEVLSIAKTLHDEATAKLRASGEKILAKLRAGGREVRIVPDTARPGKTASQDEGPQLGSAEFRQQATAEYERLTKPKR